MRLDLNVSPELYAVTLLEARNRGLSQSAVIRERLALAYGVPAKLPGRIYPREGEPPRSKISWRAA